MSSYSTYKNLGDKNTKTTTNNLECLSISNMEHKMKLIKNNTVCVIDVYGDWCGPCKTIAPQYAEMARKYNRDGVCVLVKENADLKLSTNVRGVPTFQFFKNGQYVDSVTGADLNGPEGVEKKLLALLSS
jgi:thioredoxin 1